MVEKETQKLNRVSSEEFREEDNELKWYYKWWVVTLVILFFGSLGLVLLWFRPSTNKNIKIAVTVVILFLTAFMTYSSVNFYREMLSRLNMQAELLK